MKLYMPNYYKNFKCIADKCKNSCCEAGWEIDIDEKSLSNYQKVSGNLGEKLNKYIEKNPTPHFKLNKNGTCPFLQENKLCELYANLGEKSLCYICTEHPRYYEYFDNIKEGGIGLCCEEAARIVLSQTEKFGTYITQISETNSDQFNTTLFDYLKNARNSIIEFLEKEELPLNERIKAVIWYANTLQQNIDFNLLDNEDIILVKSYGKMSQTSILKFLTTLEPNSKEWIPYLNAQIKKFEKNQNLLKDFENKNPIINTYLKNLAIYFIWRYFLKGVYDEEILSKIKFMAFSILALKILFFCNWIENNKISLEECIKITTQFSEEIEYSDENLNLIFEATYNLEDFSTENFLNMLN